MGKLKKLLLPLFVVVTLLPLVYLLGAVCPFGVYGDWREISAVELTEFTLEMNSETTEITLPTVLNDGTAGQSVVLTTTLIGMGDERLYFKSVFAPLQVYINDELVYDYGSAGTMPSFLQDPATKSATIELPDADIMELRLEYTYPTTRSDLILDTLMVGGYPAIFNGLLDNSDANLFAYFVFISMGLFLFLMGLVICLMEPKGSFFVWLGLISLCCGLWGFGECDLMGLIVHNETLLNLVAFTSIFYLPVFVHCFFRSTVGYRNEKPVTICIYLSLITACIVAILQATALVSFYNSVHYFTYVTVGTTLFAMGYTLREWRVHGNVIAKQSLMSWGILIVATIIEGIRFSMGYLHTYGQIFCLAVMAFIIINAMIGAMILRKAFALRDENRRMEHEYKLMEVQVAGQQRYHHLLMDTSQTIRQQRHDLHHQLAVMHSLAKQGKLDKMDQMVADLKSNIPAELQSYCDNITVNTMVSYYVAKAKANGVTVTVNLVVPELTQRISDSHLCVIFGNILENAVEACGRMSDGGKFITLNSHLHNGMLVITQKNSFQGAIHKQDDNFYSSKREEFGIGLSSVQSVAQKHGGDATFEVEGRVFHSSIYVQI
ncbi:GHKL domain-containing protein [Bengtsoniella intestinalis]|uniref:sensor histidine kinase n=1 Tax=Bengtsoniella intestinalis TaxID=3073143 RepID=UPI00391F090E